MITFKKNSPAVIRNVQILRGLAALLVVFVHLDELLSWLGLPPFGGGGVDIFFVISGFIMVYTTIGRETKPWAFMADRLVRIVPSYWTVTLCLFSVAVVAPTLLQSTRADWHELLKSLMFVPFEKSNGLVAPTLFVGWTLNYEMFFYFLFAGGLVIPNKKVGVASVIVLLMGLFAAGVLGHPEGVIPKFYTAPIILEFALGMVIGVTCRQIPTGATILTKSTTAVGVLLGIIAVVVLPLMLPNVSALVVCGLPAALVVGGAIALERWGWTVRQRWLLSLGNASYSIYLIHPFVTEAIQKIAARMQPNVPMALALLAAALVSVCVLGMITHRILERPLSTLLRRVLKVQSLNPKMVEAEARGLAN